MAHPFGAHVLGAGFFSRKGGAIEGDHPQTGASQPQRSGGSGGTGPRNGDIVLRTARQQDGRTAGLLRD